jgi:adenine-specific DNA-methyltransferase
MKSKQRRSKSSLLQQRAREMRHAGNLPEASLWRELRGRRFSGLKFRRQHPLGRYIVDFYCAAAQLVVELDGVTHRGRETSDQQRQDWLEAQGLKVLRCPNHELYENLDGLLEAIWHACRERMAGQHPSPPAPLPSQTRGEGR